MNLLEMVDLFIDFFFLKKKKLGEGKRGDLIIEVGATNFMSICLSCMSTCFVMKK